MTVTETDDRNENEGPPQDAAGPSERDSETLAAQASDEREPQEDGAALASALLAAASEHQDASVPLSLDEQLKAAILERDAILDKCRRAQAELENYRRRVQKEREQERRYQALPVIRDFLPGLDNLARAIEAAENSGNVDELAKGVGMVAKQFEDVLARHLVLPIEPTGKPFDPHMHEAVQQLPSADHEPMTVLQEIQRGYILHDRVVRPSTVIVSSAPPPSESDDRGESETASPAGDA